MSIKSTLERLHLEESKIAYKNVNGMSLKDATGIVLNLAEAKWIHNFWRKLTPTQEKAIRMVSAYVEHGRFPFND